MHVFGKLPADERFSEFIYAVVRYENSPESLRGVVKRLMEKDPEFMATDETLKKDVVDRKAKEICTVYLARRRTPHRCF